MLGFTLPNAPEKRLNKFTKWQQTTIERPPYGTGLPGMSPEWRDWLLEGRSAQEMLVELCDALMLPVAPKPAELTIGQLTEAVRRCVALRRWEKCLRNDEYWSEDQCTNVAMSLCREAQLVPAKDNGTAILAPITKMQVSVPHYIGTALTLSTLAARFGLNALGLRSEWIDIPEVGLVHVYDSGEPKHPTGPPLILQHGACTTGYSMGLLAGMLLTRRRILIPDLLDFDYSFSSTPKRTAKLAEHVAQTVYLVKHYAKKLGISQLDLCGHSHGGHIVAATAHQLPGLVRRLVLLCPGGLRRNQIFKMMNMWQGDPDLMASRVFPQLPLAAARVATHYAQAVFKSPNMCNLLLSAGYDEYVDFHPELTCPVLLLWGTQDTILEPRAESELLKGFNHPGTRGYWIEGGSHVLVADSLMSICPLMEEFLDDWKSRPLGVLQRALNTIFSWTKRQVIPMARPPCEEASAEHTIGTQSNL